MLTDTGFATINNNTNILQYFSCPKQKQNQYKMSDSKNRVVTSFDHQEHLQQKKGQEENVDLDSGFVSSYIASGPIDCSILDSNEIKPEVEEEKKTSSNVQTQREQEMDSAYIDSGLLSTDMSKLEINPQIVLPKPTNNEVYFQCNEDGDT